MSEVVQSVTVEYSDIKSKVKKRLSIIGKRLSDKQGNILFAGVTLSSAEEDIMKQHLKEATETTAAKVHQDSRTNLHHPLSHREIMSGRLQKRIPPQALRI